MFYMARFNTKTALFVIAYTVSLISAVKANEVDLNYLHNTVKFLTKIHPPRNYKNPQSLDQAANFIFQEGKKYTSNIEIQKYRVDLIEYKNIILRFGKADQAIKVIGAHYDVYGNLPGADDNASGVAGLLLLAKYIAQAPEELKGSVELVFYTLEEPPYFRSKFMGSYIHAKSLKDKNLKVSYMLSLECIGYYSDEDDSQSYPLILGWFYPDRGNFIAGVGRRDDKELLNNLQESFDRHSKIEIVTLAAPSLITGIDFSDHKNYWEFGWPAAMITDTAFMRNKNYHQPDDTIDTLNFEKMQMVVEGVYSTVLK